MNLRAAVGERRLKLVEEGNNAGADPPSAAATEDINVVARPRSHMMGVGAQVPGFARCACWGLPSLARESASHGDPILVITVRSILISFRRKF
jgi:hypothetical protein